MQAIRKSELCFDVRIINPGKDLSYKLLLQSDHHIDNPKTEKDRVERHLQKAKDQGYGVIFVGDFFCAMQGTRDRRGSKKDLLQSHIVSNYFDQIIDEAVEFLEPYADNILIMFEGNHETAVTKNNEISLLYRTTQILTQRSGSEIHQGGYHGFVRFKFSKLESSGKYSMTRTKVGYFNHGNWGGIVSKGSQSVIRYSALVPDADFVASGHTHDQFIIPQAQYKLRGNGTVQMRKQHHIKIGGYKEEFNQKGGWAIERIGMPKPLGCAEIEFVYDQKNDDIVIKPTLLT